MTKSYVMAETQPITISGKLETPVSLLVLVNNNGNKVVEIKGDGTLKFGDEYTPSEAAQEFWGAIQKIIESKQT